MFMVTGLKTSCKFPFDPAGTNALKPWRLPSKLRASLFLIELELRLLQGKLVAERPSRMSRPCDVMISP